MVPADTNLLPLCSAASWLWNVELGGGAGYAARPTVQLVARLGAVAAWLRGRCAGKLMRVVGSLGELLLSGLPLRPMCLVG